ncbi:MAG TPA: hypothetical protein QF564_23135 [Pirellulaceae bacterium]|nr:hypothetical protein [Pirellulaceae bacterium]
MDTERSEKHEAARNTLPDDLNPVFDELVEDYKFATVHSTRPPGARWPEWSKYECYHFDYAFRLTSIGHVNQIDAAQVCQTEERKHK